MMQNGLILIEKSLWNVFFLPSLQAVVQTELYIFKSYIRTVILCVKYHRIRKSFH